MMRRGAGQIGALILACAPWVALDASELSRAADLRAEAAAAARTGQPLIVIYSRDDCRFCQTIKREHLGPMAADTQRGKRLMIREIGQDRDTPLIDFQGQPTTHAAFATREKIKLVPVVAFYGPNGRKLAEPIVGARLPDFYQSYLDDAIEQASRKLKQP